MTHPDNTAGSWRDFADELTENQIGALEARENPSSPFQHARNFTPAAIMALARKFAAENALRPGFNLDDVPQPPDTGVHGPGGWHTNSTGDWQRWFDGTVHHARTVTGPSIGYAAIHGTQFGDGTAERTVELFVDHKMTNRLTAAQARALGDTLIAAADEMDRHAAQERKPLP